MAASDPIRSVGSTLGRVAAALSVVAGVVLFGAAPAAAADVPPAPLVKTAVLDMTNTLTIADVMRVSQAAANDEDDESRPQIGVLIEQSLNGAAVEERALEVARAWGIGPAADAPGRKSGVLLYMALDDRKIRIEVASGASAALTDAQAKRIITSSCVPGLKAGDVPAAVTDCTAAIRKALDDFEPRTAVPGTSNGDSKVFVNAITFILIAAVPGIPLFAFIAARIQGRRDNAVPPKPARQYDADTVVWAASAGMTSMPRASSPSSARPRSYEPPSYSPPAPTYTPPTDYGSSFGGGGGFDGGGASGSW